jgi:Outer membrane protein beta-barrel domain
MLPLALGVWRAARESAAFESVLTLFLSGSLRRFLIARHGLQVAFTAGGSFYSRLEPMKMRTVVFACLTAALVAVTPATSSAQDKLWHVNIGGGPTFINGDLGSHFAAGWGPAIGLTLDAPSRKFGFQFEYAYRYFSMNNNAVLPVGTSLSANHQTQQLDFNFVANLTPHDSNVRGYLVLGPGMYYRKVEITQYVGSGIICDPYWYVCGTYPISAVLGSRGGWDFGFNVGGGVGFRLGEEGEFYIETRYHYTTGPDIEPATTLPAGTTNSGGKATGQYIPLTFGFRF